MRSKSQQQPVWLLQQLVLLCLLLEVAAGDVQTLLGKPPLWSQNRSADIVLDFTKADPNYKYPNLGPVHFRGKELPVRYHLGYYYGNVAVVRFGTKFFIAVRKTHYSKIQRTHIEAYPLSKKPGKKAQS
jgi:hypothetical protein